MRLRRYRCEIVGSPDPWLVVVFVYANDMYDAIEKAIARCGNVRVFPELDERRARQ